MRTIIALLFAFLAFSAFAKKHHEPTKMSQAFKLLVQMADSDDESDVLAVLQSVQAEIQAIVEQTQSDYSDAEAIAQDAFANYQSDIEELSAQLDQVQAQIEADQSEASDLQAQIDTSLATINQASQALGDEQIRRANAHAAFQANFDALSGAIDAAQEAENLLVTIANADASVTMMEIAHKKLAKAFKHIHHTISQLSLTNTFTAMTTVLLETAQNGVNQDFIQQVEDLVQALIDTLGDELDNAVDADNADAAYSANAIATLQSTIDAATESANNNQDTLDQVNDDLATLEQNGQNLYNTLQAASSAQAALVAQWVATQANYEALLARLEGDIEAISDAETFFA